ncbi:MAG: hypothetical protein QOI83_3649 [Streptomycetaceae bacterium]|nr:hypothetical protein [Streptomycetaceae bacterium]
MDPSSIRVLVTFVGGPAGGQTEQLPLNRIHDDITVSGVRYRTKTAGTARGEGDRRGTGSSVSPCLTAASA